MVANDYHEFQGCVQSPQPDYEKVLVFWLCPFELHQFAKERLDSTVRTTCCPSLPAVCLHFKTVLCLECQAHVRVPG